MTNELAIVDGFDAYSNDPTSSPIRGTNIKFKNGGYFAFSEPVDVRSESYVVIDQHKGWQKLERDCPPEYLMQKNGEPRPQQPHVAPENWPLNLNGQPEHPWKLTTFLWLLNTKTGEISTFWTNTIGGSIAIGELSDQVAFMRQARPHAMPVIALGARDMRTQYRGTKPRPHFHILGWRQRSDTGMPALLTGPEQNSAAQQQHENFAAEEPADTPVEKTAKPASEKKTTAKTTKRGGTRIDAPKLTPIEEPSSKEILNDKIDF